MAASQITQPVEDTVPKINDELAVGEDLDFQRKWWRFEDGVWILFALIILLDLAGAFGRGPLAKVHAKTNDGTIQVGYERVERFSTPSILTVHFGSNAIHDGKAELWVSESLLKGLGNQRVIPQPVSSTIGEGGVLYQFDASHTPASAEFALEPSKPGIYDLTLGVPGAQQLALKIFVMP